MASGNPLGGQIGRVNRNRKRGPANGVGGQAEGGLVSSFPKTSCWKIHAQDPFRWSSPPPPFPLRGTTLVFPIPSRLFITFWLQLIKQWHIWKYVFDVQFAKNLKLHGSMVHLETIRRGYVGTCPFSEELKCTFDVHVPACLLISFHAAITLSLLFFSVLKMSHVSEKGCNIHLW